MSELLDEPKPKICLEIEFDNHNILQDLAFSAKTEVLGGHVTRVDFQGDVFSDVDFYRDLFDGDQMAFLLSREDGVKRAKEEIYYALKSLVGSIKLQEKRMKKQEEIM